MFTILNPTVSPGVVGDRREGFGAAVGKLADIGRVVDMLAGDPLPRIC